MSNTEAIVSDRRTDSERTVPRAILHKQILDAAEQHHGASMEELAEEVSLATTGLVERVLKEYGDPGVEEEAEDDGIEDDTDEDVESDTAGEETAGERTIEEHDPSTDEADEKPVTADSLAVDKTATNGDFTDSDSAATPSVNSSVDHEAHTESGLGRDGCMNSYEDTVDRSPNTPTEADDSQTGHSSDPALSDLTEKQRETLVAIHKRPIATQAELADELGVTSATINQRVNSIDGFDWADRRAFSESLFDRNEPNIEASANEETSAADGGTNVADDTAIPNTMHGSNETDPDEEIDVGESDESVDQQCTELNARVEDLTERFESLEQRLEAQSSSASVLSDPELGHKVIHACFTSDRISEEEELEIIENMLMT